MGAPAGSKGYVTVTIVHTKVLETNSHFPWRFDLSKITAAAWWANVSAAGDIVVVAPDGSTIVPRIVDSLDTSGKTGTILWDASVSISVDQAYQIHTCPGYGAVNSSAAGTNANCFSYLGFQEASGNFSDPVGGYTGTAIPTITYGQTGQVRKAIKLDGTAAGVNQGNITQHANATALTLSFVLFQRVVGQYGSIFSRKIGAYQQIQIQSYVDGLMYLYFSNDAGMTNLFYGYTQVQLSSLISAGVYFHCAAVWDATQTGNARLKFYINGVQKTLTYGGAPAPATLPPFTGSQPFYIGLVPGVDFWDGNFNEARQYSAAKSANWLLTEYNSMFDPGSVATGTWVPAPSSGGGGLVVGIIIGVGTFLGSIGIGSLARKRKL